MSSIKTVNAIISMQLLTAVKPVEKSQWSSTSDVQPFKICNSMQIQCCLSVPGR